MRKLTAVMAAVLLATSVVLAQPPARTAPAAPQPVREGNMERLILDDGTPADAAAWSPAEATITSDSKHAKHGDTALRFHIDVNWETGEKNYPIGWPRINRKWPEPLQDWSRYDYFEFSVYTESSRTSLPGSPLGLNLYDKSGKKGGYSRDLSELKLGQWVDFRIPVSELSRVDPCGGIQFYISEANYRDKDVLDFWIDDLSLTRYVQPTVAASSLAEQAIMSDSRYLTVDLNVMGVRAGQSAEVTWQITGAGGKTAATGKLTAPGGARRYYLALPEKGLPPGVYDVTLKCDSDHPTPYHLIVAPSPWQEGSK